MNTKNAFQRTSRVVAIGLMLVVVFLAAPAWPHGGEDHSGESLATTAGPAVGAPIFLPKELQFGLQIRTARASEATRPVQMKALGTVVTPTLRKAQVHSPFTGRVLPGDEIPQQGAAVAKGQVIARIEQSTDVSATVSLNAEITRTESELQQAREGLTLAEQEVQRVSKLGDAVSGRRKQEGAAALSVSRQRVAGLKQTLEQLHAGTASSGNTLRVVELASPTDGVISAADIAPGEFIEPAKMLFEIIDPSFVWVEADIYEMDLATVQDAKSAVVLSDAYPDRRFEGSLVYLGSTVSPESRTVKAAFGVDNSDGLLREGMVLDVFIESKQTKTGLMIPKAAISTDNGRTLVYVKESPEIFTVRPITTHGQWDGEVMVEEGLKDGETVAVAGLYQIRMSAGKAQVPGSIPAVPVKETKKDSGGEPTEDHKHKEN